MVRRLSGLVAVVATARGLVSAGATASPGASPSSRPSLRGQGNASVAAGATRPRALSDSRVFCENGYWDNINWCGGGGVDWSCTPWNFKVDWTSDCEAGTACFTPKQCDGGDGGLIVGDDSGAATYIAKWQKEDGDWCDSRCDDDPSYFVFHTCDGSGLQSDCKGASWYVEQLSQWNGQGGNWNSGSPQPGQIHPTGSSQVSFNFNHPGTGHDYEWYWCGWWSMTSGWKNWDPSAGWLSETGVDWDHTPSWAWDAFGGADADATMVLYPWICTVDNDPAKTGIQPGAAMYSGDHSEGNWNCFCDNNGPDGHPWDTSPPPHYKFYSMKQEKDSEGNLYMHVIGVAGDAIDPGVTNEDFRIYGFSEAW